MDPVSQHLGLQLPQVGCACCCKFRSVILERLVDCSLWHNILCHKEVPFLISHTATMAFATVTRQ